MKKTSAILAAMLMVINITKAQWTELGTTLHPLNANNLIYSVVTDKHGNVYAAGEFSDSSVHNYVGMYTGDSAWIELGGKGTHALKANGYIYSLATDTAGNIYAAGAFTDGSYQSNGNVYVAKWVDTAWVKLGTSGTAHVVSTLGLAILSIAVDDSGYVYAAGTFKDANNKYYVAKYKDSIWTELGTGTHALNANEYIHSIAVGPSGTVYAAGAFTDANGTRYVAQWDGTNWTELGTGGTALNASSPIPVIMTDHSGNVYAGYNDSAANFYVAEWNNSSWQEVGAGPGALNANGTINALTTDAAGNIYAAGNFTDGNDMPYVAKYNDTAWSEVGVNSDALNPDAYITTIATDSALNVYAAGFFTNGGAKCYVAQYNPNTQQSTAGIKDAVLAINRVSVSPNPVSAQANITLFSTASTPVYVTISDMAGRDIATVYNGQMQQGEKTIGFGTESISAGVYTIKVSDGKSFTQARFVKL